MTRFSSWTYSGGVSEEKVAFGRLCKRLIDRGRIESLKQIGIGAKLTKYVDVDVTPENICLIGS